jgi:hypothetical protein
MVGLALVEVVFTAKATFSLMTTIQSAQLVSEFQRHKLMAGKLTLLSIQQKLVQQVVHVTRLS